LIVGDRSWRRLVQLNLDGHLLQARSEPLVLAKSAFLTDGRIARPRATFCLPRLFAAKTKVPTAVFALWEMFP